MSNSCPVVSRMFSIASLMMDRVLRPRKSIFIKPVSSITEPSYWVTNISSPVSLSLAVLTGTTSEMSYRPMMTPHACTPVLRTFPSNICAYFKVSRIKGSRPVAASFSSGTYSIASFNLNFFMSGILSGTNFANRFDSARGSFSTRATSLMADLVAIVPYVMICATRSAPYFSVTQRKTSPLPSSSKSVSISGNEIRSGFKKRSNSKSYLIGSIFVIPKQ